MTDRQQTDHNIVAQDEAKLDQLEREEHAIEAESHSGFGDAIHRIRLGDDIRFVDDKLVEDRERAANDRD
jgi:hypothetical protein